MSKGLLFDVYKIKSPVLLPYVQYILFNYSADNSCTQLVTSYANTNICLGIVKEQELISGSSGIKHMHSKPGIHAYLSGMYLQPHKFEAKGTLDEICIDFSPLGYYHFFRFPAKTYILGEDILTEGFGSEATRFFEDVFDIGDLQKRGMLIEQYLLKHLLIPEMTFMRECLYYIHRATGEITLSALSVLLHCSEKKIVRAFLHYYDLTPKDYIRIVRFRKALNTLNLSTASCTAVAYDSSYYDQSHFIKDFKFFTEKTPRQIKNSLVDVQQNVLVGVG